MVYKMNVGNELAQIKNCKNLDEIKKFLEDHNLIFDHWYFSHDSSSTENKNLYIVAYYQDLDEVFIQISFNF